MYMKMIMAFILSFCFLGNVYASNIEYRFDNESTITNLSERIEDEENEDSEDSSGGALQYFILIAAFLGICVFFLYLKNMDMDD